MTGVTQLAIWIPWKTYAGVNFFAAMYGLFGKWKPISLPILSKTHTQSHKTHHSKNNDLLFFPDTAFLSVLPAIVTMLWGPESLASNLGFTFLYYLPAQLLSVSWVAGLSSVRFVWTAQRLLLMGRVSILSCLNTATGATSWINLWSYPQMDRSPTIQRFGEYRRCSFGRLRLVVGFWLSSSSVVAFDYSMWTNDVFVGCDVVRLRYNRKLLAKV